MLARLTIALGLLAAAAGGCAGSGPPDRPERPALLALGGPLEPLHAPIVLTIEREYDAAEGVHLRVRGRDEGEGVEPAAVELRLLSVGELARARRAGRDAVAVMALRQDPPLLLVTDRSALDEQPAVVRAAVRALRRGMEETVRDPESAVSALQALAPQTERVAANQALADALPSLAAGVPRPGWLDVRRLRASLPAAALEASYANAPED